jgi:NADH dehydrogenase
LAFTIFRPSLIYGPDGEFTAMLRNWSQGKAPPFFFMPFFGGGFFGQTNPYRISPVYVEDVAQAFCDALTTDRAIGEIYSVGGPEALTWPHLLAIAAKAFRGRPKAAIGIPSWFAKTLAATHLPGLPFTRDQVVMALEDNATDNTRLLQDFPEIHLHKFEETLNAAR